MTRPEVPRPRPAVDGLPVYKPGKAADVAMQEHGLESAVKLASNENPYEPLPAVVDALSAAASRSMARYADHRATAVREALAARHGLGVEQVAVGCGSVGLLQQLLLTYADPGDEVLYGWRSFEAYPIYTRTVGATEVAVPNRFEALDMRGIAAAVTDRTRLVLVTSPNNPTGTGVRAEELEAVLAAAPRSCLVVLDEAYHEYATGAHLPHALDLLARHPNLAVLRTFSKAYGLAALRIGYLFAHPDVVSAVDRTLVPFAVNGLAQVAALASLLASDQLLDRVHHTVAERERVAAAVRGFGLSVPDPQANFVWLPAGEAAAALTLKLETLGVVTRPFPGEGVRVTIGRPEENERFLAGLEACLEPLRLAGHWRLPTGDRARAVQALVERIDAADERLVEHATLHHAGLTDPDPDTGEQWDAAQVWAHLAEFPAFWLGEVERVVDGAATFGRPLDDPGRTVPVAHAHDRPVGHHLVAAQQGLAAVRAHLAGLGDDDLARTADHPVLGPLAVIDVVDRLVVGHVEAHLGQLDALVGT